MQRSCRIGYFGVQAPDAGARDNRWRSRQSRVWGSSLQKSAILEPSKLGEKSATKRRSGHRLGWVAEGMGLTSNFPSDQRLRATGGAAREISEAPSPQRNSPEHHGGLRPARSRAHPLCQRHHRAQDGKHRKSCQCSNITRSGLERHDQHDKHQNDIVEAGNRHQINRLLQQHRRLRVRIGHQHRDLFGARFDHDKTGQEGRRKSDKPQKDPKMRKAGPDPGSGDPA